MIEAANGRTSVRGIARQTGMSVTICHEIVTGDLEMKNLTQVRAQRVKDVNVKKRAARCEEWVRQMENNWESDPRKIYFTDEKVFRIGEVGGGNRNYRVLVSNKTRKCDLGADAVMRDNGAYQGGCRVMVCLGATYHGVGNPFFVPKGKYIDADFYATVLHSHYSVEAAKMFRKAGISDYVFQQDGAPAHTSKATQRLCAELFPNFISKERWPSTSPDLNPLDYFVSKSVLDLQLAIEQAVSEIPPKMIQAAIDGFYKRCKLCLAQGGETCKHVLT